MTRKYKLRQTLLMPGMEPIILPTGYKVELKGDRYVGEGGWYFARHGVEDNQYHWEEVKEPEKFIWNDELVKEFVATYNKIDKLIDGVDPIGKTIKEWKQTKQAAIERCLNDEGEKTYTQADMDKAIEDAFYGARKLIHGKDITGYAGEGLLYVTPQHYLSTINKKP